MSLQPILARRMAQRQELLDLAQNYVGELARRCPLAGAIVFGSVARGDFNIWSDVDLLLIAEGIEGSPLERMDAVEPRPPLVQPIVWTPREWRVQAARSNPIVREALAVGVWLRGSPEDL